MIATYSYDRSGTVRLSFKVEDGDQPEREVGPRMAATEATFRVPQYWDEAETHPDLLALGALLCAQPFIGERLIVSHPVSQQFHDAVGTNLGVDVGPVDHQLVRRKVGAGGVPGLAFSGGVDSTAAIEVLPQETVCVFLDRDSSAASAVPSLYRPDAARAACVMMLRRGYRTLMVATDLEHLRHPVGFPTDLAPAAPLVLVADLLGLDSVSWGTIAESAYRIGHQRFTEYYERRTYTAWQPLFESVGLPVLNPVAGVSEVGTSKIVREQQWLGIAQSCIRGAIGEPCLNCWKCFRKSLLDSALVGAWPSNDHFDRLFAIPEARKQLSKVPIKHENVVAFILSRYDGRHPDMMALRRRVRAAATDLDYLERWYGPAAEPWPEKYAQEVADKLDERLGRMESSEEAVFRSWDLTGLGEGADYRIATAYGEVLLSGTAVPRVRTSSYLSRPMPTFAERERQHKRTLAHLSRAEERVAERERELAAVHSSLSYRVGGLLTGKETRSRRGAA